MPKPGKKSFKNNYYEHDYRGGGDNNQRRVSFKPSKGGKYERGKDWAESVKVHLADEDIDMGGTSANIKAINHKKFHKKGGNRAGSPMPNTRREKRRFYDGPMSWFRVVIPYGNKYDKNFILKTLIDKLKNTGHSFIPIAWYVNGTTATFYVDNYILAENLYGLDRQIQMPDGFKMIIKVSNGCPSVDINTELKEKMKLVMAKRYNAATKALDLTKFHSDPDLQHIFCALSIYGILVAAFEIMSDNIPELEALNLFDNKIHSLRNLKKIVQKLPNLKILHMGNNKINNILQLESLVGLPIIDLVLDGNPLCDRFKDKEAYISEVRKMFPKVIKLDGVDLPPPISFDISTDVNLPEGQQTYLCNPEGQAVIAQFLEQYFQLMDSDNRSPLQAAYHEQALYSMTMAYPPDKSQKNGWLNWYSTDNRNLMRITDSSRRHKLLKQGQTAILAYLQEMPATKHDIMNFTVDLNLCTAQMLLLTVAGLYKELRTGHKVPPIRHFFRTLVIVPAGSGFCIANEELHVTNATDDQIKQSFKTPTPAPAISDIASVTPLVPDLATKKQMVETLAQQSGMNMEWSERCLAESNWDFQNAIAAFSLAQKEGKIPPGAFVK